MTSVSRGNGCHNILRTAGKRYTEIAYMRIFWYSMGVELASSINISLPDTAQVGGNFRLSFL
jgi:hypothetical protein